MNDNPEMHLIAAMAIDPATYHEALSLGADKIITDPSAAICMQHFDPTTGEFDSGAIVEYPDVLRSFIAQDVHGSVGSFRVKRMVERIRAIYQKNRMLAAAKSVGNDPDSQLNAMSSCILELGSMMDNGQADQQEIADAFEDIDLRASGKRGGDVIMWPLRWMDRLGPIGKQEFIVFGGRPGSGKSAAMGQICYEFVKAGKRCLFLTLEMSRNELRHRFAAYSSGFSLKRVDGLDPTKHKVYRSAFEEVVSRENLLLQERYSISAIISAISREKLQGLDAVFIDYLQLIGGSSGTNRLGQLSEITRLIKLTAKDLRVPIFCGSQLNRQSESQDLPNLSSLRESGTIEQDADRVILLHEQDSHHLWIQAKCRSGSREMFSTKFTGETTSFDELRVV